MTDTTMTGDARALADHVGDAEAVLSALPPKPDRDAAGHDLAGRALDSCRQARHRFMSRYADEVYDVLTHCRTRYLRLAELAYLAAERFPGLLPTPAQLDAERRRALVDKEGREIDQGIFFSWLLRSPAAGAHLMDGMLLPTPAAAEAVDRFRRDGELTLGSVRVRRRGPAAHLTVTNGECLNAEDDALVRDLETAVDLVLLDDSVRVGVLRGGVMSHPRYRGRRVFCSGINLKALRAGRISYVDFLLTRELGYVSKIARGLLTRPDADGWPERTTQKPWVAAVDTFAIGGGMQLLLVFDHVVAAADAYFCLPAAREGIVPGLAGLRLGRLAGGRLARQVILGGRTIRATDPEAALVCDEVVPSACGAGVGAGVGDAGVGDAGVGDAVGGAVEAAVRSLDNPAVLANRRLLNAAEEPPDVLRAYLAEFALTQAMRLYSGDVAANLAAGSVLR